MKIVALTLWGIVTMAVLMWLIGAMDAYTSMVIIVVASTPGAVLGFIQGFARGMAS